MPTQSVFNEFIEEDHKYLVEAMKRNAIVVVTSFLVTQVRRTRVPVML